MEIANTNTSIPATDLAQKTVYPILFSIAFAHLLNDLLQAVIPAAYPILKDSYQLTFTQIGLITFAYQMAASILQPIVGLYTDKKPKPYSQIFGMVFTLSGIILLAYASSFPIIILSVVLVGIGSSIFHPEASRISFLASGGKRGLAQSIFQLGGNAGTAIGPLLVALIVVPNNQHYIIWFAIVAIIALFVLSKIAVWYQNHLTLRAKKKVEIILPDLSQTKIIISVSILLILIFSKFFYMASISSYFTFYLMDKFQLSIQDAQFHLFLFLASCAIGTLIGGPLGDKFGRKYVIWFSVLGAAPFTLLLPYVDLFWTGILSVVIGIIISSAFPAILVYAQELLPKKLGMVSGLFYGFAFGMGGLGSALLGNLADHTSIDYVYHLCAYLPLIGFIALFLPNLQKK
ncbi:FSR family fosmidomycin resistance protein-like MFS transporter [Flavobacterium arsenatis]|uniref:FSR family fosmidomycin resistance protein-like MFS transporter n=1 Tax=Flavobacterium arsenatis TaxID=1484332 RepID=A0ABU1TSH9_9FLAO|nr:MFS transporter [Flavobacterium arsenatis]MDR6968802.1 FSR family fosmidomycin resistance protein-like MFS transporter [Flavobacterium arsenatis]